MSWDIFDFWWSQTPLPPNENASHNNVDSTLIFQNIPFKFRFPDLPPPSREWDVLDVNFESPLIYCLFINLVSYHVRRAETERRNFVRLVCPMCTHDKLHENFRFSGSGDEGSNQGLKMEQLLCNTKRSETR